MAVEIHNGQIIEDGAAQAPLVEGPPLTPPKAKPREGEPEDNEPEELARQMAAAISSAVDEKLTPMEIVNRLLTLKTPGGHKLVWTRFDVNQAFAIFAKKLEGKYKL